MIASGLLPEKSMNIIIRSSRVTIILMCLLIFTIHLPNFGDAKTYSQRSVETMLKYELVKSDILDYLFKKKAEDLNNKYYDIEKRFLIKKK